MATTLGPPPPDDIGKATTLWARWLKQVWDAVRGDSDLAPSLGTVANTKGVQTLERKTLAAAALTGATTIGTGATITTPTITVPAWTAPTFTNAWVNYDAGVTFTVAGYYRAPSGRVYLKGLVKDGTVGGGTPIFTLPVGCRPPKEHIFATLSADALGHVRVRSDGTVVALAPSVNTWVSLDGLSFLTT